MPENNTISDGSWIANPKKKSPTPTNTGDVSQSKGEWINNPTKAPDYTNKDNGNRSQGEWINDPTKAPDYTNKDNGNRSQGEWINDPTKAPDYTNKDNGNRSQGEWINDPKKKTPDVGDGSWIRGGGKPQPKDVSGETMVSRPTTEAQTQIQAPVTYKDYGLDEARLRAAGMDDTAIAKIKLQLDPLLRAQNAKAQDLEAQNNAHLESLQNEQKIIEEGYQEIANNRRSLVEEQQSIVDESAKLEKERLEQERKKQEFAINQEKVNYQREQAANIRAADREKRDLELRAARALSSSMGASFSSNGILRMAELEQQGDAYIADLKSEFAWGKAEFAFRLDDIAFKYNQEINLVETGRRDANVQILQKLNDDLAQIDERILLSAAEKEALARQRVDEYFDEKSSIDEESAELISSATKQIIEETEKIKEEKEERETLNLEMSRALGFMANAWGEPINTDAEGNPTLFTGDFNDALSKQFGFLVDNKGNAIRDESGNKVKYTDPTKKGILKSLGAYLAGNAGSYDLQNLNGKIGTNDAIINAKKPGYYTGKYGPYQCGEFLNDQYYTQRFAGSAYTQKQGLVHQYGGKKESYIPNVGDTVVMDMGTKYGHIAIINSISEDGNSITISQANWPKSGVVSHDMVITKGDKNWNKIYGFADLPLKEEYENAQPAFTAPDPYELLHPDQAASLEFYANTYGEEAALAALKRGEFSKSGDEEAAEKDEESASGLSYQTFDWVNDDGTIDVNHPAITAMKLTESDRKTGGAAAQMARAEDLFTRYEEAGVNTSVSNSLMTRLRTAVANDPDAKLGVVLETLVSEGSLSQQELDLAAAQGRWVSAKLRLESGAAISASEFVNEAFNYFPQEGAPEERRKASAFDRKGAITEVVNKAGKGRIIYDAAMNKGEERPILLGEEFTNSGTSSAIDTASEGTKGLLDGLFGFSSDSNSSGLSNEYQQALNDNKEFVDEMRKHYPDYSDQEIAELIINKTK